MVGLGASVGDVGLRRAGWRGRNSRLEEGRAVHDAGGVSARGAVDMAKFTDQPCQRCGAPRRVVSPDWLRAKRLAAGLTLREFAARRGVSAPYISDIEHGRRNCLPAMLAAYEAL